MADEERPYPVGASVYVLYPVGTQEPGTTTPTVRVLKDGGGAYVETTAGSLLAERLRRDRRGRKLPVYEEVPRG